MNQSVYETLRKEGNPLSESYNFLFSDESIRYVSKEVTKHLHELYPRERAAVVTNESIKGILWEKYVHERKDPMVIREETIKYLVNHISNEKEIVKHKNSLDPWIQNYDGNYGLVQADMNTMKLNHRRGERVNFDIRI